MFAKKIRFSLSGTFLGCGIILVLVSCKSFYPSGGEERDCIGAKEPISNHHIREKSSSSQAKSKPQKTLETEKPQVVGVPPQMKPVDQSLPELKEVEKMVPASSATVIENEKVVNVAPKVAETKPQVAPVASAGSSASASQIANKDDEEKGPINFKGDGANRIIEAKGRDVVLSGDNGVFVITGGCGRLALSGGKNQIQCDSVAQIEVVGDGNTLILGSVGGGRIRGNGNNLSWGSGVDGFSPIVESFGTNNSMKRLE